MFDDAPVAYQSLDDAGRFLDVNLAWVKLMGYSREEVIGKPFEAFLVGLDTKAYNGKRENFKKAGYLESVHVRLTCKNGNIIDADASGRVSYDEHGGFKSTQCVLIDVTKRRLNELKMRKLVSALDESGSGVLITDLNGRIQYVNKEFSNITGYMREDIIGKNPSILQSGQQDVSFYINMWKSILDKGEWTGSLENRRKNGEVYTERLHIRPIHDASGKKTNYVGSFFDVSQ